MNALMNVGQQLTMSSLDLLSLINNERAGFGECEVRRNDFHARLRDELEGDYYETFVVPNSNGTESVAYKLTLKQCMYVAMRESKGVRRKVQEILESKSKPVELSRMEILQIAMEAEQGRLLALEQRDEAIRTKAEIGSRREATAMATASAKAREVARLKSELGRNQAHATVKAVEKMTRRAFGKQGWRPLRDYCIEHGLESRNVVDEQYGTVKAWPAMAWRAVYGIDLETLFPVGEE